MQEVELSLIILCYKGENNIIPFVNETLILLKKITTSFEIILIGNYIENSQDKTPQIVQNLAKKHPEIIAITKVKKGMLGWDLREGLKAASGKYFCIIDGDGQFPLQSIEKCFIEIKSGNYDLVKTYRSVRKDGIYRKAISIVFNIIFDLLFPKLGSRDVNSKPKILKKCAYQQMDLKSDDWFIDAEIMINIKKLGMKTYEFPVEFKELEGRKSFVKVGAIFEFIMNLISYRFLKY